MRSLQLIDFGAPLEWRDSSTPEPQGGEVLLETIVTGVCHSDLHLWEGFYEMGGGERLYAKDRGIPLPLTMGHEVVGRVVAVGPEVGDVRPGDIRLVYPWIGCRECKHCAEDRLQMCSKPQSLGIFSAGGYSDHVLVPDARFLIDIEGLEPESACAYACAGLTAYSALGKTLPLEADEHLVLIGAGGLGMMAAHVVESMTRANVVIVDVDDRKLEAAAGLGRFATVNSRESDAGAEIMRRTDGNGVSAVVDFVGAAETASLGASVLAKHGMLVLVGLFGGALTLPIPTFPLRNLTVRGSYTGSLTELRELIALVKERRPPPLPVTRHGMDAVPSLLEEMRDGKILGRAVVGPASTR